MLANSWESFVNSCPHLLASFWIFNYDGTVLVALLGIFGLLLLSTGIIYYLALTHRDKNYTELKQRVRSWWAITFLFTTALILNRKAAILFFAFVSFLSLKEYLSLIPTRKVDRRVLFLAYLAVIFQYYWISIEWYGMFLIFIPVYMFLVLPTRMVLLEETKGFLKAVGTLHWGLMLTVFSLSHVAYLLVLPAPLNNVSLPAGNQGLLLYLVFLTCINDIAQYVWGKNLGRHQVLPVVSPKKTWEGLLGGIGTTTVLAVLLAPWLTPFRFYHALMLGLLLGLFGFLGDITVSALKRDLGVKDSGNLLPGHGGILDRIDSLTYTAPLFFHFTVYFYYGDLL